MARYWAVAAVILAAAFALVLGAPPPSTGPGELALWARALVGWQEFALGVLGAGVVVAVGVKRRGHG